MVKVCDAIMGSGKTSATITYINEHPKDKFIYVTPFLEEARRVKSGCPKARFVEPSGGIADYHFTKSLHSVDLIEKGRNIATTHESFKRYTRSTLDKIKEQGYILIMDESVDTLESFKFKQGDLKVAVDSGYIEGSNGIYSMARDDYDGDAFREMFSLFKSRTLSETAGSGGNNLFYWTLTPELLTAFKEVFVLTYLFEGQSIHHFMKVCGIPYKYIGIDLSSDGKYRFCDEPKYIPEYVANLGDMINILDAPRMNKIGEARHALSMNWFNTHSEDVKQLKRNMDNYFNNIWRGVAPSRRLWGSYACAEHKLGGKGYTKAFLVFNSKATNKYKERDHLVYAVNIFMNSNDKHFYRARGLEVDEDLYALSTMVQWIWRSAIRDGKKINIYIPSKRMRTLLIDWINKTSKGVKQNEQKTM